MLQSNSIIWFLLSFYYTYTVHCVCVCFCRITLSFLFFDLPSMTHTHTHIVCYTFAGISSYLYSSNCLIKQLLLHLLQPFNSLADFNFIVCDDMLWLRRMNCLLLEGISNTIAIYFKQLLIDKFIRLLEHKSVDSLLLLLCCLFSDIRTQIQTYRCILYMCVIGKHIRTHLPLMVLYIHCAILFTLLFSSNFYSPS